MSRSRGIQCKVEDMHVPCTSCLHYLLYVFACIRTMAIWPSGLRRQNQDLVRKGEGSNPSVVINHFHIRHFCLVVPCVALSTDVTYRSASRLVCKIFSCRFTDKTEVTRCTKMISRRVLIFWLPPPSYAAHTNLPIGKNSSQLYSTQYQFSISYPLHNPIM
jgi:hypothetical protein